jgi:hypothetical protein
MFLEEPQMEVNVGLRFSSLYKFVSFASANFRSSYVKGSCYCFPVAMIKFVGFLEWFVYFFAPFK